MLQMSPQALECGPACLNKEISAVFMAKPCTLARLLLECSWCPL